MCILSQNKQTLKEFNGSLESICSPYRRLNLLFFFFFLHNLLSTRLPCQPNSATIGFSSVDQVSLNFKLNCSCNFNQHKSVKIVDQTKHLKNPLLSSLTYFGFQVVF